MTRLRQRASHSASPGPSAAINILKSAETKRKNSLAKADEAFYYGGVQKTRKKKGLPICFGQAFDPMRMMFVILPWRLPLLRLHLPQPPNRPSMVPGPALPLPLW